MIKDSKGITLVSLLITIALMLIISSITISVSMDRFEINDYNKMINDLKLLEDKVSNYYLKYNAIPIVRNTENSPILYDYTEISFNTNENDNEIYYILDLSAMEGISLNYGETGFEDINSSDDVYIINEKSHQIYYVRGVELNNNIYHSILNNDKIHDIIPPTKPEIKIISNTLDETGTTYVTSIEIVPGKDNNSGISKTEYTIVQIDIDGNEISSDTKEISDKTIIKLDKNRYIIRATSYDIANNKSSTNEVSINNWIETEDGITNGRITLKIGDYVNYNELENGEQTYNIDYTLNGGTSTANSQTLKTENLEWRVLGLNDNGQIQLISADPTEATVYLNGEKAYLNCVDILDGTVNQLYGKGNYVANARALKAEDINKIAKYDPATENNGYNKEYEFRFSDASTYIQYREKGIEDWIDSAEVTLKKPGDNTINKDNHGSKTEKNTFYSYYIPGDIIDTVIADMFTKGTTSENITYFLASPVASISLGNMILYRMQIIERGYVYYCPIYNSRGFGQVKELPFRPVVELESNVPIERQVNGVWQISE